MINAFSPSRPALRWAAAILAAATATARGQSVEELDVEVPTVELQAKENGPELDVAKVAAGIVKRTNSFRQKQDLDPVKVDPQLAETAKYFADFMARTGKYGHRADGKKPSQRAQQHEYEYCIVLENIAYAYRSTDFGVKELIREFVSGWKESEGHRKNMLDPAITETGVAVSVDEQGQYFAVQMFGRPKEKSIQFKITNATSQLVRYRVSRRNSDRSFPLSPLTTRTHSMCRPSQLVLLSAANDRKIQLRDGQMFVIQTKDDNQLTLTKTDK